MKVLKSLSFFCGICLNPVWVPAIAIFILLLSTAPSVQAQVTHTGSFTLSPEKPLTTSSDVRFPEQVM